MLCDAEVLYLVCMINRRGKDGYIKIDEGSEQGGQSQGSSIMVNTKGNIYLGAYHIIFFPLLIKQL